MLEIGTYSGYSSLSMAAGLPPDGHIDTLEVSEKHADVARRYHAQSPYADRITVHVGPALETLERLSGPWDFVFIDADKVNYRAYYDAVLPQLAERGLMAIDNTLWSGRVAREARRRRDPETRALKALNDHIAADPGVVAVMLTVRDGVTLVRRAAYLQLFSYESGHPHAVADCVRLDAANQSLALVAERPDGAAGEPVEGFQHEGRPVACSLPVATCRPPPRRPGRSRTTAAPSCGR